MTKGITQSPFHNFHLHEFLGWTLVPSCCDLPRCDKSTSGWLLPWCFSLFATSQVEASSLHTLIPWIPKMKEINGVLTPFSRRSMLAYLSRGPHLMALPRVPSYLNYGHFVTSTVEKRSLQPPNLRICNTRWGSWSNGPPVLWIQRLSLLIAISQLRDLVSWDTNSWPLALWTFEFMKSEMLKLPFGLFNDPNLLVLWRSKSFWGFTFHYFTTLEVLSLSSPNH